MQTGFSKIDLMDAVDWKATAAAEPAGPHQNGVRETKFGIADRVAGLWRPEKGGPRRVIEPLHISMMYGEDDQGPFVLAAIDHCDIEYQDLDRMRAPILAECAIAGDRVVFMPSHCHVTLAYDTGKLQHLIATAVRQAKSDMSETDVNAVHADIEGKKFVINRQIHVPGIGTRTIMFNDFCEVRDDHLDATEQIKEWLRHLGAQPEDHLAQNGRFVTHREVDDRLQALFFRDAITKKIKGSVVRFAAHAVIVSEKKVNGDISADYPGYLKKRIENQVGGISLFGQGLSGDLRPLNPEYSHAFARIYGERLADLLIAGLSETSWEPLTVLKFRSEPLLLALRKDLPTGVEQGEEQMNRIEKEYDMTDDPEQKRKLQNEFWFHHCSRDIARTLRPGCREQGFISTLQYGLRLNDSVLLMSPGELFHETGFQMVEPSASAKPLTVGNINEYISYIPPRDKIEQGGYEPSVCIVMPGSAEIMVNAAHKLMNKLFPTEA